MYYRFTASDNYPIVILSYSVKRGYYEGKKGNFSHKIWNWWRHRLFQRKKCCQKWSTLYTLYCPCGSPFWKNSCGWPWLTTSVRCASHECSQRNAVNHAKLKTRCCCFETAHLKFHLTNDVLAVTIVLQKWPVLLSLCFILSESVLHLLSDYWG